MSLSRKLFRDLTDEELIEEAMKAVPDYLEMIRSTGNFDLGACLGKEFGRLESLFKSKHGIRSLFQADPDERAEIDAVETRLRPVLTEKTRDIQQRYLQSRKVSQINGVTAKALIGQPSGRPACRQMSRPNAIAPAWKCGCRPGIWSGSTSATRN